MRRLLRHALFLLHHRREEANLQQELASHVAIDAEERIAAGDPPELARRAAARDLGNVAIIAEDTRATWGWTGLESLLQDVRFGIRQLQHGPGFAGVVIATLALGIGATTAVFSVLQAVLLAPLPYEHPGELVRLYQQEPDKPATRHYLTGVHFSFIRDHATSFGSIAALANYSETGRDLVKDGRGERLRILEVTSQYFQVLRSGALRGPGFERIDEDGRRRVILSDSLWRTQFGADLSAIGAAVHLSGEPYTVAGIAPPGFEDPVAGEFDAWLPYDLVEDTYDQNNSLTAVARLRRGVTVDQAQAELESLNLVMKQRFPGVRLSAFAATPLHEDLVAPAESSIRLLFLAVGLLLLVACVNVANLSLARATGRVHEFATRSALGAASSRLFRQLLVESLLLAALGGLVGLLVASSGVKALQRLGAAAVPRLDEVSLNPAVLVFAFVITLLTAVACGAAPGFRFAHIPPIDALRQQSRSTTGTRGQRRSRSVLAAAQLAIALTLLVGAGVLVASFYRLQQVDIGFRADDVLTFEVNLPPVRYEAARRAAFHEELAQRLRVIPGVVAAGGASFLPATGSYHGWGTSVLSGPQAGTSISRRNGFNIQQRIISGGFFEALEIPVLAGRAFDARDDASAPARAVVSASFASAAFPGMPLTAVQGQRIAAGGRNLEIIGVVGDVTLNQHGAPAVVVYHAHRQFADDRNWTLSQVVATTMPPEQLLTSVRSTVASMDPELVVHRAEPLTLVVDRGTRRERFALVLMATFAGVSLLLAALGLYGVLAYSVRQRTQEIGIRMALGASAAHVRLTVVRQAMGVLGAGLLAGTCGAWLLGRWLTSLVFEVSPWDPRILMSAVLLLTITGLIAAWLPARRASSIEPRIAMNDAA
jgi:predicted permease